MPLEVDVSPWDNSGTKKEGVAKPLVRMDAGNGDEEPPCPLRKKKANVIIMRHRRNESEEERLEEAQALDAW